MSGIEFGKAAASAGAWAWKLLENPFIDFLKRRLEDAKSDSEKAQYLQTQWNNFNWGKAAERYRERMKANYGFIRVLGTSEPKSLDDLFTDVYILTKPLAYRRFDVTKLHELQEEPDKLGKTERAFGLRLVVQDRGHRLYILGAPGAGKTTFLKHLVHQTMIKDWGKFPVFITIKDWADSGLEILDFIIQQFDICHFPYALPFIEYILETGKAVILFDGLDEVKQEDNLRTRITTNLHNFARKYTKSQIIVTCRVAASDYSFTEFTYVEISDFTDGQIENYAYKWFGKDIKKAEQFLDELKKPDNQGVRDLGRSPLLLSMVCLAYDETLHIPQRRVELYEEALDALLKKWDASRNIHRDEIRHPGQAEAYKKLSLGRKKQMFARIAAEAFEKGEIFFHKKQLAHQIEAYFRNIPPADATDEIDGEIVLRAIEAQHGIMTERAQGIYSYSHLTFQEYYTARYINDNAPSTWDGLVKHMSDQRWREVFLLTSSLPDKADQLFFNMIQVSRSKIQTERSVLNLQKWVEKQSGIGKGSSIVEQRSKYWYMALVLNHAFALNLELDTDFSLALDLGGELANFLNLTNIPMNEIKQNLENTRYLKLASTLVATRDHTFIRTMPLVIWRGLISKKLSPNKPLIDDLANNLEISLLFILVMARIFSQICHMDFSQPYLIKLQEYYQLIKKLSENHSIIMSELINKNIFPVKISSNSDWQKFELRLRSMVLTYFGFREDWLLSGKQSELIKNYFQSTQLILDCLEVAYVQDREAILSKILTVESSN